VKAKCGSILNNDDKTNKSSCLVKVGSCVKTKPYGLLQLVGKNQTNLKVNNIILNYSLLNGSLKII